MLGSLVGLLLLAPFVPVIALLIKADSRGPVLYVQERVGEGGKVFRMYKFRSMVEDAEAMPVSSLGPGHKPPEDPRVTRIGKVLRLTFCHKCL